MTSGSLHGWTVGQWAAAADRYPGYNPAGLDMIDLKHKVVRAHGGPLPEAAPNAWTDQMIENLKGLFSVRVDQP